MLMNLKYIIYVLEVYTWLYIYVKKDISDTVESKRLEDAIDRN